MNPENNLAEVSGSVGLLIDRCVRYEQPIGTVWLVDKDTVATCAHLVVLFADFLRGLKVSFPASGRSCEIVDATFHPRFDHASALEMAQRSLSTAVPALALQDHNLVLLKLSADISELKRDEATGFNKKLAITPMARIKGLAGTVEDIGLALVLQTVSNARKDGVLYISDERNRPLARIFFSEGKMRFAKFGNLHNEYALYQMFQKELSGQFFLQDRSEPDWAVSSKPMDRNTDMLLLEAHRRLDELPGLATKLGGTTAVYKRAGEFVNKEALPSEIVPYCEVLWPHLNGGVSIDQLSDIVGMDNYQVYAALVELSFARLITPVAEVAVEKLIKEPLEMAAYERLSPWDEIVSVSVHPENGRAQLRGGNLVGLLRPNDPYHLLHTIHLPYRSAGSPIFKNGKVIGMHCGKLPLDPTLHALPQQLHQLLWVDSVQSALTSSKPQKRSTQKRKSVGMARELADGNGKKICGKCQSPMVKQAVFCGTCGNKL